MAKTYDFCSHEDYVAACEQLAEDLVSFEADSMEFTITIKSAIENKETVQWLDTDWRTP